MEGETETESKRAPTLLDQMLEGDDFAMMEEDEVQEEINDQLLPNQVFEDGMCVECGDRPVTLLCEGCNDSFCQMCFQLVHKRGTRKTHVFKEVYNPLLNKLKSVDPTASSVEQETNASSTNQQMSIDNDDSDSSDYFSLNNSKRTRYSWEDPAKPKVKSFVLNEVMDGAWFEERAKYIPLRLTSNERKFLRLLEASLYVSEYTDRVDSAALSTSKAKRTAAQLREICAIICGVGLSYDYEFGFKLTMERSFGEHDDFKQVFEIGRRHKIMNPEKMRSEYGKLVYLLQDGASSEIQNLLMNSLFSPVLTVSKFLQERNCGEMLKDPLMEIATREILAEGKERYEISAEIKQKEKAIKNLCQKYKSTDISSDEVGRCLYSIGDNHSFLRGTRYPIDRMINYLKKYFSPDEVEDGLSLAIVGGENGARLTHNHARQYHYVLQSLLLWQEVVHDMFKLWILAEEDLLDAANIYKLKDTGQGINRVQQAPRIHRAMQHIVHKVQTIVGDNWVGSSVVHLGDHNVPNSLMFIDKYTQIPRILNPIEICLRQMDDLVKIHGVEDYLNHKFGGLEKCKKLILADFFKFAFDGSGADNFFDAGSCIDGRLTSAWNWCSQLEQKPFYHVFLLTGFVGFDGQF